MEKYEFERPENLSDSDWEDLCDYLDSALDNFLTDLEND